MQDRTWNTIDKSTWRAGPWRDEPDKIQWTDESTGLPCLIKRSPTGALCGYVGVAEDHPWYGKGYDDVDPYPEVHGGLTYADRCQEGDDEGQTICHVPEPGEPDNVWWLGFDCAHAGDLCPKPGMAELSFGDLPSSWGRGDTYKPLSYVRAEVVSLAAQAKAAS